MNDICKKINYESLIMTHNLWAMKNDKNDPDLPSSSRILMK